MTMVEPLRVVLCEDDRTYRTSLAEALTAESSFEVVDAFNDAESLLAAASESRSSSWGAAILDVNLPRTTGIEAVRKLKALRADLPVLMLTVREDPATILDAICNGADGYLLKRATSTEIVDALRSIANGGSTLTPGVARSLLGVVRARLGQHDPHGAAFGLTERELEVLRGLARGRSYKQVAADLSLSLDTIRTYVRRVYGKLQVHSVAEAIQRAIRAGIV